MKIKREELTNIKIQILISRRKKDNKKKQFYMAKFARTLNFYILIYIK